MHFPSFLVFVALTFLASTRASPISVELLDGRNLIGVVARMVDHSRPLSLREEEEQDIPGWKRAALALDPNTPTPPPWKREQAASPPHWKRGADSEGSPAWKREESSIYPPPWRRTPPPTPDWKREVDTLDAPGSPDWRREPEENVPPPWKRTSERPAPPPWKRAAA